MLFLVIHSSFSLSLSHQIQNQKHFQWIWDVFLQREKEKKTGRRNLKRRKKNLEFRIPGFIIAKKKLNWISIIYIPTETQTSYVFVKFCLFVWWKTIFQFQLEKKKLSNKTNIKNRFSNLKCNLQTIKEEEWINKSNKQTNKRIKLTPIYTSSLLKNVWKGGYLYWNENNGQYKPVRQSKKKYSNWKTLEGKKF